MSINLQILTADKQLSIFKKKIEEYSYPAIKKVQDLIPVDNADIVIYSNPFGTIKDVGIGGRCISKYLIMIAINPGFPDLSRSLKNNLCRMVAHELYHCLRNYSFGKKWNLLQSLINEGLAGQFAIEVFPGKPQKWDMALDKKQLQEYLVLAKKEFNNDSYDHRAWFFGSNQKQFPRWTGYSLGFYLVGKYLKNHPDKKPSSLFKTDVKDLIK